MDRASFQPPLLSGLSTLPARLHHEGAALGVLTAAWRHKALVLGAACAALAASAGVLTVLGKSYAGEAVIQIDPNRRDGNLSPDQVAPVALEASAVVQSEARIIRSRMIARRVADRLGLAAAPEAGWSPLQLLPAALRDAMTARGDPDDAGQDPAEAATRRLLQKLTVESDSRSYLITIRASSDQPQQAARIANAVAEEYVQWRLETSAAAAERTSRWLDQQFEAALVQLRQAENAVTDQRGRIGLTEIRGDGERLDQQQMRDIAAQLSAATLARINEEGRLARVQELQRAGAVPSSADLSSYPTVQQLAQRESVARKDLADVLARFGPRHPSVVAAQAGVTELSRALAQELERAVGVIEAGARAAQRTEQSLKDRLDALRQVTLRGRNGEVEYRERAAAAQTIRDRIASLTRSREQALAQRELRTVAAAVVVRAEPAGAPVSPKPLVVLALGLLGGLGAGVGGAALLERRDLGLRTAAEVAAGTGHRCLGTLPELAADGQNRAMFDEAVRSVGAGVGLFGDARECQVVLVTSSVPDEGAATLCRALRSSLAAAGQRVLLIDGAPHRLDGRVARGDGAKMDEAGKRLAVLTSDMLAVVQRGSTTVLTVNAFGSANVGRVIEQARKQFDTVLIEAPPVLLVADALVLGRAADRVILAARWNHTRRASVLAALNRLRENSVAVDGLALTRVDLRRQKTAGADQCAYYVRERRYYERLARPADPPATDIPRVA